MLRKKINKMVVFWIFVILLGTGFTIFGSLKLNEEWTKNEVLKQAHTIPDFLLLDCELEVEIQESLRNEILKNILPKIAGQGQMETLYLSPFFDQLGYETSEIKKSNYALPQSIYDTFLNFNIIANAESLDKSITIHLHKNTTFVKLSAEKTSDSYIQVLEYNSKTNLFKLVLQNIILDVRSNNLSQQIIDLNKGLFTMSIISKFKIKKITNTTIKTRKIDYFKIPEFEQNNLGQFEGNLKLLI